MRTLAILILLLAACRHKDNPPCGVITSKYVTSNKRYVLVVDPLDGICDKGQVTTLLESEWMAYSVGDTICMYMDLYGCPMHKEGYKR